MRLKGKKVLVVGLGRSGIAATRFLLEQGARVAVTDQKGEEALREALRLFSGTSVEWQLATDRPEVFEKRELICVSPGVPGNHPGLARARRRRIPIYGEMGLAAEFLKSDVVAVTGTNGKSTTATLIAALLKSGGQKAALAGNIGKPVLEVVMERQRWDWVVLEVSSFQLETMPRFHPKVAVLLNVTEDHLDRYSTFQDYLRAKLRILKDQTSRDWAIYNHDDTKMAPYLRRARAKKVPFSMQLLPSGIFFSGGRIVRRWKSTFEDYPLDQVKLVGRHNMENMMASIGAARACGVAPDAIRPALNNFAGLPHRMELVREWNNVRYYDDSKGTNVDAVVKSLAGFASRQVILIAGGRNKGMNFKPLRSVVAEKVKLLLLIGESAPKLARALDGCTELREVKTLHQAVQAAREAARPEDVVLLSPACASFDQFKNYQERGEKFKEFVNELSD